jgi:hypothetical protein
MAFVQSAVAIQPCAKYAGNGLVLATCGIRSLVEAFANTQSRHLLLADSEEEEYNLEQSPAHLH